MKKYFILGLGILLVGLFGYFGWKWNLEKTSKPENVSSTSGVIQKDFQIAGSLVRNNPGLKPGIWYLLTDLPGQPAVQFELGFKDESDCSLGSQKIDCDGLRLPNGTRVRVVGDKSGSTIIVNTFTAEAASDLITVDKIISGAEIQSPLSITGSARGQWFFEASFPVRLVNSVGNIITTTIAEAKGDWMTSSFVPYSATISFDVSTRTPAELVLAADNPSGLPQNDRNIKIPVILLPSKLTRVVNLYYYNSSTDKDSSGNILCSKSGLVSVKREIKNSDNLISDTLNLLLAGRILPAEKSTGVSTEFPLDGFKLVSSTVENGVAILKFLDPKNKTTGGSCRVGILWNQIEATVKQFTEVKEVKFEPETLFQP